MSNSDGDQEGGIVFESVDEPEEQGGFQETYSPAPIGPSSYPVGRGPRSGMGWKTGCMVAALAGIVLASGVVFLAFTLTGPAVKSANGFLALIGQGNVTAAYKQTAAAFQQSTDEETFKLAVDKLGLDDFSSASWSNRSIHNNEATLEGTVTTRAGGEIPLTMTLMKDGEEWKVYSFTGKPAGAMVSDSDQKEQPARHKPSARDLAPAKPAEEEKAPSAPVKRSRASTKKLPPEAEMIDMARESILALDKSVRTKDFTYLYNHTSNLWQKQTSPEELKQAFQSFIDKNVDLSGVAKADPEFDPAPFIDSDGLLTMNGAFSTGDYDVTFELKYAIEKSLWKLVSMSVNAVNN